MTMKISPSSPSSGNSKSVSCKRTSSGCFSEFFSCLVCSKSSRKSSSIACIDEISVVLSADEQNVEEKSREPNIVAKLMGLESMAEVPKSIGRSRSASSLGNWPRFYSPQLNTVQSVNGSLSFRELPTYLQREDKNFFFINFEPDEKYGSTMEDDKKKFELGFRDAKDRKNFRGKNNPKEKKEKRELLNDQKAHCRTKAFERRTRRKSQRTSRGFKRSVTPYKEEVYTNENFELKSVNSPKFSSYKEISDRIKVCVRKKNSVQPIESSPENLSPVSVLDVSFLVADDFNFEMKSEKEAENLHRELTKEFEKAKGTSFDLKNSSLYDDWKSKRVDKRTEDDRKIDYNSADFLQIWGDVQIMTDDEAKKSKWFCKIENIDEIGIEFCLQTMDSLLLELVSDLLEF